ncbi:hypothetical protein [Rubritalea tangerina]|uniref:hypothetical protein n=1 Tax=Rubritalea tangerina TaxID=430798 RepID=UPI00361C7139
MPGPSLQKIPQRLHQTRRPTVDSPFIIGDTSIIPPRPTRFCRNHRLPIRSARHTSIAYIPDAKSIPDSTIALLQNLDTSS